MRGIYRDLYDTHMINAPVNPFTGHPFIPSCQLCATCIVSAWERVPEALVKKPRLWEIMWHLRSCKSKTFMNHYQMKLLTMIKMK